MSVQRYLVVWPGSGSALSHACQYVCSAWCLTCDLRLCLGRNHTITLTKMRLSRFLPPWRSPWRSWPSTHRIWTFVQWLICSPRPSLGALLAPRCALRALLCAPWRAAYACALPHASSPLCTSCTVACARLRRALPSYPPRRTPRLVRLVAPMTANPSRARAPPRSPLSLALYYVISHYVGATKRTLGLVYTPLAVLYLTVFALVALLDRSCITLYSCTLTA